MSRHLADWGWTFDVITRPGEDGSSHAGRSVLVDRRIRTYEVPAPTWVQPTVDFVAAIKRKLTGTPPPGEAFALPEGDSGAATDFPFPPERDGLYVRLTSLINGLRFTYPELVWSRRAIRTARRLARRVQYRAVIVSAPPHASNVVGLALARSGLPFIADFRDLWIHGMPEVEPMNPLFRWLGARYEPQVFREAHRIVCNTDLAKEAVDRCPAVRPGTTLSIPNGFDAHTSNDAPDYEQLRIVFTGRLYPFADLEALFAACARLRTRAGPDGHRIRVEFMPIGPTYRDVPLRAVADFHGLGDMFVLHSRSSRDQALQLQRSAAVLVAFDQSIRPSIPTKFYDYVQHRGAVLLIGRPQGSLAPAASRLGLKVFDPVDQRGIDSFLDAALQRWRGRAFDRSNDPQGIYDRRHQSRRWHDLLASVDRTESLAPAPSLVVGDDVNSAAV